jgi:hypothetical protein
MRIRFRASRQLTAHGPQRAALVGAFEAANDPSKYKCRERSRVHAFRKRHQLDLTNQ